MQTKFSLLIVEDEPAIRTGLEDLFVYHGYAVDSAADGHAGLRKALTGRFDLILLDVMLPGVNGFDICERIRVADREQPIIMLTAKTADEDIVQGLRLGADDYVGKPFSVTQLVARVEAVLRRARLGIDRDRIALGDEIEIDVRNLAGRRGTETIAFTRREMDILQYLGANPDRAVSREELLNKVWGYARGLDIETRTVDIHIAKLRRKLESDPAQPRYLVTVRGAGYRLLSG
ncbi:response regulator transcription factor [Thiocapsa roseopersicina]|uniref:Two-component system, OmpR family, response regulator RegX3 n=1 Tax=Thiocapsa roseopersicina TaxID=1058 RepID=A0A1H2X7L4_THIRO|nr:response regulator transcription factor [Thiocapsa roseopersicina]SDW88883.1 two-component system, OmpR family, response regulator RegX3 [Thiocapsa roseopersicina]